MVAKCYILSADHVIFTLRFLATQLPTAPLILMHMEYAMSKGPTM